MIQQFALLCGTLSIPLASPCNKSEASSVLPPLVGGNEGGKGDFDLLYFITAQSAVFLLLSGLAIADYLGLLEQLYGRVLILSGVWHELQRGGEDDPRITDVLGLDWIEVRDPTNQQLVNVL